MEVMVEIPYFSRKQNPREVFLALDIGTRVIKAIIFFIENEKIIVAGFGKELQKSENYTRDIKRLSDLCKIAIFRAQRQARLRKIKGVILGFGGSFVRGETFSQRFFREDPQKYIDVSELKNILQKLQWQSKEEICRRPEESGSCPPKLLQAIICEARIDGYQVTNPFDFQGKEIILSVFNSYASADFLNFLEEFLCYLKLDLISILDESFAVFQAILPKSSQNFNAIFIDVGGSSTRVSVCRKGKLEKSVEFALGGQNFTDLLTKTFGISELEAEDIKIKYGRAELGHGVTKKIAKILESCVSLWYKALTLAFEEFPFKNYLPSQIYLFGGGSLLPEIRDGFLRKKAQSQLSFVPNFKAEILTPVYFKDFFEGLEEYELPQDTVPLGLALFFSSAFEKENIFERMLKRTLRIIQ